MVSQQVGTILDVEDTIPGGRYTLEVSSPGVERKLTKASDFERFLGKKVGSRCASRWRTGAMGGAAGGVFRDVVTLEASPGKSVQFPLEQVEKANLKFEWINIPDNLEKRNTLGTIYQSIEILSKEKGIDPQIVLDAVKDAMLVAARKHFHTNEDLVGGIRRRPARIQIFAVKKVVDRVDRPGEGDDSAMRAQASIRPREIGSEIRILQDRPTRWAAFRRRPPSR